MVVIRLSRGGAKKRPFFNIVVADKRLRRDGRFIERVGFYNPVATDAEQPLRVAYDRVSTGPASARRRRPPSTAWSSRRRPRLRRPRRPDADLAASRSWPTPAARGRHRSRAHRRRLGHQGLVQGPAPRLAARGAFSSQRWYLRPGRPRVRRRARLPARSRSARPRSTPTASSPSPRASPTAAPPRRCAAPGSSSRARAFRRPATDEYYWVDLIGLEVVNREGVVLGRIVDLLATGPHTVLGARRPRRRRHGRRRRRAHDSLRFRLCRQGRSGRPAHHRRLGPDY